MNCPKCGAPNCQLITETKTQGSDFSVGKGCCGYYIFGPIGLLCGLCGEGKTTTSRACWLCMQCGNKFRA